MPIDLAYSTYATTPFKVLSRISNLTPSAWDLCTTRNVLTSGSVGLSAILLYKLHGANRPNEVASGRLIEQGTEITALKLSHKQEKRAKEKAAAVLARVKRNYGIQRQLLGETEDRNSKLTGLMESHNKRHTSELEREREKHVGCERTLGTLEAKLGVTRRECDALRIASELSESARADLEGTLAKVSGEKSELAEALEHCQLDLDERARAAAAAAAARPRQLVTWECKETINIQSHVGLIVYFLASRYNIELRRVVPESPSVGESFRIIVPQGFGGRYARGEGSEAHAQEYTNKGLHVVWLETNKPHVKKTPAINSGLFMGDPRQLRANLMANKPFSEEQAVRLAGEVVALVDYVQLHSREAQVDAV